MFWKNVIARYKLYRFYRQLSGNVFDDSLMVLIFVT